MKKSLYKLIVNHPKVVKSPMVNYFLKVKCDVHTGPQLVPKLFLQVYVRYINNNIVSNTDNSGLKEARYEDDNILISDSTLCSLFPPQLKMLSRYEVMCGCECFISSKSMHLS